MMLMMLMMLMMTKMMMMRVMLTTMRLVTMILQLLTTCYLLPAAFAQGVAGVAPQALSIRPPPGEGRVRTGINKQKKEPKVQELCS